ncbi:MAG TPA: PD-(D/E)XK nuclease family protein [Mycobacteriales bacterium]|nr:PD-(D/E)XK nuclease family protein [Mycobacteriales bacterium]
MSTASSAPAVPPLFCVPEPVAAGIPEDCAPRGADGGRFELVLSPSRAADFMGCPLRYRLRAIDRLAERPSPVATRGTLVHSVLERLFELPAAQRTPERAAELVAPAWADLSAADSELVGLFPDDALLGTWLDSARDLLAGYFTLEDPRRLEPAEREHLVEVTLASGLRLKGFVDRLDRAATGELRIVDYKTGRAPGEAFEGKALFQMKFYALVLWRTTGQLPTLLQLMYLGDREVLRYSPDEADLLATERKLEALGVAIETARATGEFRPCRSRLCDWCDFQQHCPEFGGTPPPFPGPLSSGDPGNTG